MIVFSYVDGESCSPTQGTSLPSAPLSSPVPQSSPMSLRNEEWRWSLCLLTVLRITKPGARYTHTHTHTHTWWLCKWGERMTLWVEWHLTRVINAHMQCFGTLSWFTVYRHDRSVNVQLYQVHCCPVSWNQKSQLSETDSWNQKCIFQIHICLTIHYLYIKY